MEGEEEEEGDLVRISNMVLIYSDSVLSTTNPNVRRCEVTVWLGLLCYV